MKGWLGLSIVAIVLPAIASSTADACYCGAARYSHCKPVCCEQRCCIVMKTCRQVVYEETERTCYKTVYEDVHEPKTVEAVKYVPETEYRHCACTVCEPRKPESCEPVGSCQPAKPCEEVPVQCIRKVPVTVLRPVPYQKTVDTVRCVEKKVPYTITCCVPKVVCTQVPVEVCCPVPVCCKPTCAEPTGCGG